METEQRRVLVEGKHVYLFDQHGVRRRVRNPGEAAYLVGLVRAVVSPTEAGPESQTA